MIKSKQVWLPSASDESTSGVQYCGQSQSIVVFVVFVEGDPEGDKEGHPEGWDDWTMVGAEVGASQVSGLQAPHSA